MAPVIETKGLTRAFGDVRAIESLDLVVNQGEMFGLVGPDGAGKSTAIRLLCGILKPDAGTATVLGMDLHIQAMKIKAQIGYLSQNFTLYGDLTVDENLEFFANLHGVKGFKVRRNELLDFTRLTPFRDRLAQALSGGMKKKLALACTLIHTPQIIFLDEPSTGVDPVSRGEFWNILSGILYQGVTIVMTTPYLDEAERCHRISLMHRGRIILQGTPDTVKAAMPGSVYDLTSPAPLAAYQCLRARWPSSQMVLYGDRVHLWARAGETEAREAVQWLQQNGQQSVHLKLASPTLEDAFVALVSKEEQSYQRENPL